jgi:hypothetical protein
MSYARKGSHLNFFTPLVTLAQNAAEVLKEVDIGASSGDHGELVCVRPCMVTQCGFVLTSEAASGTVTAPTVIFTKRPTPLSATNEAVISTVTVASGSAIGGVAYENCTPVAFKVGDSLEVSWTVGSGTPTGQGVYYFICDENPDVEANNSDMVAG